MSTKTENDDPIRDVMRTIWIEAQPDVLQTVQTVPQHVQETIDDFLAKYWPSFTAGLRGWISTVELIERLRLDEHFGHAAHDILIQPAQRERLLTFVADMPVYLLSRKTQCFGTPFDFGFRHPRPSPRPSLAELLTVDILWWDQPLFWWFREDHIEFQEKLDSYTCGSRDPLKLTLHWLTPEEVLERWRIKLHDLEQYVSREELSAYQLTRYAGIVTLHRDYVRTNGLGRWLVRIWDAQAFERNYKEDLHLHDRALDRLLACDITRHRLRTAPDMTTKEAVKHLRESGHFEHIDSDGTLRKYLKPLPLDRRGGRPRKTS